MSRSLDVNLIANQIVEVTSQQSKSWDAIRRETVRSHFERLTLGLAEYERQEVVWLVNFRLASPVL